MDRFSVTQAIQPKTNDGQSPASFNRGRLGARGPLLPEARQMVVDRWARCAETFQDRAVAGADLRRNSYSVRYSHLVRPQHSVRVSLLSARRIRRRSGLLGERVDRFRVRDLRHA